MRRREFIAGLGGAAVSWPVVARAQQADRVRRIGVLMNLPADDPEAKTRIAAFVQTLKELGWTDSQNVVIDYRWGGGDGERYRRSAQELIELSPDVVLCSGSVTVSAMQQVTRTVPIVFAMVPDPVNAGFVESLSRPGTNSTGFTQFEYNMSAKWVELLKEVAPSVRRALVIRDPTVPTGIGQLAAMQSVAPSFGMELRAVGARDAGELEQTISAFARQSDGGLILASNSQVLRHRELIVRLATQHRLPAVYPFRFLVNAGGLISYGPDSVDPYRRAASYIDRILKGEKAADLPVQAPNKYELVINLKTAKAIGLTVPPTLIARADEVIE